jgi:hypothetical protein
VPPENGGHGYNTPAGRSETTGLNPVFMFNNIAPAATVDEGNNWINLVYGPLTLFSAAGQDLVGGALDGFTLGAYSTPQSSTSAIDRGLNSVAPAADFFGNPRPHDASNPVDIGAVETVRVQRLTASVSPSPLAFGNVGRNTTAIQNLTIANTGNTDLAGLTATGFAAPFTRIATGSFPAGAGNCGTALPVGASCTIKVQFAPTANQAYSGSVTVAATGTTVTGSPVALSGTGSNPGTVGITPSPLTITLPRGSITGVGTATLTNTAPAGSAAVTVSNVSVSGGSLFTYFFMVGGLAGPDNCTGATLAPGGTCTVAVRFTNVGSARGQNRTGTITFTDTGAGSPQSSQVIGLATP